MWKVCLYFKLCLGGRIILRGKMYVVDTESAMVANRWDENSSQTAPRGTSNVFAYGTRPGR
jgi:hypothetical protein